MPKKFSALEIIRSYFFPKIIDQTQSLTNPYLEVSLTRGRLMLNTTTANYSYGGLHKVFQIAFKKKNVATRAIKNVLILGFGAGSVASILFDELKLNVEALGVEKDEPIIALAQKHFDVLRFTQLKIIAADAFDFLMHDERRYDLIVIDLYVDINVPEKFEQASFLQLVYDHLNQNGLMVFNKVAATQKLYKQFTALEQNAKTIFDKTEIIKVLGLNRVIYGYKT